AGRAVMHVMSVRLKASPDFSRVRLEQAEIISNYLRDRADADTPVVLLGDFNTYGGDVEEMSRTFESAELVNVPTTGAYTWRSRDRGSKFDHIWMSRSLQATNIKIAGPCNGVGTGVINRYTRE